MECSQIAICPSHSSTSTRMLLELAGLRFQVCEQLLADVLLPAVSAVVLATGRSRQSPLGKTQRDSPNVTVTSRPSSTTRSLRMLRRQQHVVVERRDDLAQLVAHQQEVDHQLVLIERSCELRPPRGSCARAAARTAAERDEVRRTERRARPWRFGRRNDSDNTASLSHQHCQCNRPSRNSTNSPAAMRSAVVPGLRRWPSARSQKSKFDKCLFVRMLRRANRLRSLSRRARRASAAISGPHLRAIRLSPCSAIWRTCASTMAPLSGQPRARLSAIAGGRASQDIGKSVRVLTGHQIAIGCQLHGVHEGQVRRRVGRIHRPFRCDLARRLRPGELPRIRVECRWHPVR